MSEFDPIEPDALVVSLKETARYCGPLAEG